MRRGEEQGRAWYAAGRRGRRAFWRRSRRDRDDRPPDGRAGARGQRRSAGGIPLPRRRPAVGAPRAGADGNGHVGGDAGAATPRRRRRPHASARRRAEPDPARRCAEAHARRRLTAGGRAARTRITPHARRPSGGEGADAGADPARPGMEADPAAEPEADEKPRRADASRPSPEGGAQGGREGGAQGGRRRMPSGEARRRSPVPRPAKPAPPADEAVARQGRPGGRSAARHSRVPAPRRPRHVSSARERPRPCRSRFRHARLALHDQPQQRGRRDPAAGVDRSGHRGTGSPRVSHPGSTTYRQRCARFPPRAVDALDRLRPGGTPPSQLAVGEVLPCPRKTLLSDYDFFPATAAVEAARRDRTAARAELAGGRLGPRRRRRVRRDRRRR